MGRFIFNQPFNTAVALWGLPLLRSETPITLDFPTNKLRQRFPQFPQNGSLQITFINNTVQRWSVSPDIDAKLLFEFLFQYLPPTHIQVAVASENTGLYQATICLGDGIGADIQITSGGDNYTQLYYNEDFVAPYDLLEAQDFHPFWDFSSIETDVKYSWLSDRKVTEADVRGLGHTRVYSMWQSIYARKGLIFYNERLKPMFARQSWYYPRYRTAQFKREVMPQLTTIEQFNLNFLKHYFRASIHSLV